MNRLHLFTSTAALALAITTGALSAQAADTYADHHPGQDAAVPVQQAQTAPAPGGMPMAGQNSGMPRMDSMPNPGSAGHPMMGGDMQQMMRMMGMMQARMARAGMDGAMGATPFQHVEGRIAFLRAEIGITDAQQAPWNAFADALRGQAATMRTMRERMMQGGQAITWPGRIAREEEMLSARLDAVKAIEGPARSLYAALSTEQKAKADELMGHPMGPMGRM
jgi:hypothetical protein